LIEAGADVNNQANYDANSPLHVAARFGNPQIVQLLLKHNADINLLNRDEETAFQMAEYGGSSECINLLK
jgi:ankyrin repeat protein